MKQIANIKEEEKGFKFDKLSIFNCFFI